MLLERAAQNALRTGVGALYVACAVQHHHTSGEVIQYGLYVGACAVQGAHAALHRRAGIGQLLRHIGK